MKWIAAAMFGLASASATSPVVAETEILGNWFHDPFVQVSQGYPRCPVPLGPFIAQSEMPAQEHSRAERGTRCFLEGKCSKPNSYLYDEGIASELTRRFANSREFAGSTLWITVQRRFVWIEGCVRHKDDARALEALARSVTDVDYVLVHVTRTPRAGAPYPVLKK